MPAQGKLERIGPYVYRHFTPPPLPAQQHARVAIVGGGPVGLATALGLARQGVTSVVIEADDSVCMGSRAICISRRSLEICDRLGALPEMLERGLPWSGGRSFWQDTEVFRFSMPLYEGQRLPPMINLQQYYIEDALLVAVAGANAEAPGLIDMRWATTVDAIEPQPAGVTLSLSNALRPRHAGRPIGWWPATAARASCATHWACAGRHGLHRPLRHRRHRAAQHAPDRTPRLVRPAVAPRRHRADAPPARRPVAHRLAAAPRRQHRRGDAAGERAGVHQRHLDAIGEGHLPWQPAWSSIYRAGAMTLQRYRHGRVLFAGNAAHAMPIFGVRGLNSGLDDADNLAWKLAAVVQGGPEALLDSYSAERVQAFHVNAESARRSTEFMSPPSRGFDVLREAVLSLAAEHRDIAELINPRQTAAVAYTASPLSTPDADAWQAGPRPGEVLPEVPVAGPVGHVTEVVGPGFVLLHFGTPPAWAAAEGCAWCRCWCRPMRAGRRR